MTRNSPGQALRDRIEQREKRREEAGRRLERGRRIRFHKLSKRTAYEVLEQETLWYDFEGEAHTIKSMSIRYKRNLLRWLERNAADLHFRYLWSMPYPHLNGEMAQESAERDWEREQREVERLSPLEWVQRTPLYEAVQRSVIQGEDGPDGEGPAAAAKLERYRKRLKEREEANLAAAEEATWD